MIHHFLFQSFSKIKCIHIGILSIFLLLSPQLISAGKITGYVKNALSDHSIKEAKVHIDGTSFTTYTDSSGIFTFNKLTAGSYNLTISHDHFETQSSADIYIAGNEEKTIEIKLLPPMQSLDKIKVKGSVFRKAPEMSTSTKTMNFDEILRAPGALVDIQRVVQDLPSVSSSGDNTNEIIVRGGNPGENLMIMDNIEIPNPNHFASQSSGGGVISLINPLLVKGLTFCAGAPPALYGGKASSVLDVKLRDGNNKMILGGIDIGMAGAGLHAEGPLWPGATFMASGTKSFLDFFADYSETKSIPEFWGLQAKISQNAGKNNKLYANFIYGKNNILINDAKAEAGTNGDAINAGGQVYASGVNWDAKWKNHLSTTLTLSATGNTFERFEYTDSKTALPVLRDTFFVNNSKEQEQQLKFSSSLTLGNNKFQIGGNFKRCDFDIEIKEKPDSITESKNTYIYQNNINTSNNGYKCGAYFSSIIFPIERFRLIPGIRTDYFSFIHSTTVSPRLGMVFSLLPGLELTGAFAVQYQDPDYENLGASPANKTMDPKQTLSGIGGIEYIAQKYATKFSFEGFYKKYNHLPVNSALLTPALYDETNIVQSIGKGYSYGLELFIHKKLVNNFSGSLAYSYSRAFTKDLRPGHFDEWYRSDYDFRHAITITSGYKMELLKYQWYKSIHSKWWAIALSPFWPIADRIEISAKWRYLGGRPWTKPQWNDQFNKYVLNQNSYNQDQMPDYHKLDIRFEKRYGFGYLHMIYYFDLQNIYNRANVWMYMFSNNNRKNNDNGTPIYQFRFFPAGGVIIGF
jgi:hypothetical protein